MRREEGLTIWHYGCIVCNGTIRAGKRVTLQCGVNIAENVTIGNGFFLIMYFGMCIL